jgi:hypothetical protein
MTVFEPLIVPVGVIFAIEAIFLRSFAAVVILFFAPPVPPAAIVVIAVAPCDQRRDNQAQQDQ